MRIPSTKKLLFSSVASFVLGFGILAFIRLKTQNTSCYYDSCTVLNFLHKWVVPIGQFLFVLSIITAVFAVGRVLAHNIKRLILISVGLLLVGDGFIWLCQRKLSDFSAYHDGSWFDYKYTYLPIAIFIFALGVAGFLVVVWRLFLNKNSRKNSSNVSENGDSIE